MFKIRIKKQPQKGDQADYSLYNRTGYAPNTKETASVSDTLGPVPREEATLEAEGGETVVGDVNQDGYLEHFKFRGKRHSQGGVPANIPAGSFIYSDTKKMRINDENILKHFGLSSFKKGGVTPATLAKQYDINKYRAVLSDENSDPIAKRTAQFMLDNNLKKLAELALVQESMKGFPDGIPAIAESVMGPMDPGMGQPAPQEMQQARYGGMALPKAQEGQQTGIKKGTTVYINGNPVKIADRYKGILGNEWAVFDKPLKLKDSNGNDDDVTEMKVTDLQKALSSGSIDLASDEGFFGIGASYEDVDNLKGSLNRPIAIPGSGNTFNRLTVSSKQNTAPAAKANRLTPGFKYTSGNAQYEVVDSDVYDGSGQSVKVRQVNDPNRNVGSFFDSFAGNRIIPIDKFNAMFNVSSTVDENAKPENMSTGLDAKSDTLRGATGEDIAAQLRARNKPKQEYGGQFTFATGGETLSEYEDGGTPTVYQGKDAFAYLENNRVVIRDKAGKVLWQEKAAAQPQNVAGKPTTNDKTIKSLNEIPEAARKYAKWDPAAKRFRIELPDSATYEERNAVSSALTELGFKGIRQSANSRIKGSAASGYNSFYAGLTPQDFERKFVEAQLGKDASDKMDEVTRRKEYFKLLGVTNVTDEQLKDPKKLYNDKTFMADFYQKFQATLPKDEFRPVMGNDASFGLEHFDAIRPYEKEKTGDIKPKTEEKTETKDVEDKSFDTTPTKESGWWLPDIANFAAALTDKVSDYPPSLQQVNLDNPDYVLLDPSRQVASIKEQEMRQQQLINNTASGQVARANMLGVAGESGARSADVLANYENQNVQIVNNAYAQAANTNNQEAMMNQQLQDQFMVRSATYGQQKDNSERQLKQRKLNAFLQGTVNNFRKKQTEQVLFPQVYIDPITGDATFSGKGKDMNAPDGFYTGTGASTGYGPNMYAGQEAAILKAYMDKGYTREEALQSARSVLGKTIPTGDARNRLAMQNLNNPFAGYTNLPGMGQVGVPDDDN